MQDRGKGKRHVFESRQRIDRIRQLGNEEVTDVRLDVDASEAERRQAISAKIQYHNQLLLEEAEISSRRNAAVAMRWDHLSLHKFPHDLQAKLDEQKAACDKIIGNKNTLVAEFSGELNAKEEEYVRMLKMMRDQISTLTYRMDTQTTELKSTYSAEIEEIEGAFMQERHELLESNRNELESLLERRRQLEVSFIEQRANRIETNQLALESLRMDDAEEYNLLKITRESEIQLLEQQLEEMRATYQLNTEKLEYNYRVLMERDQENNNTIAQQKRKLARMQDVLSGLINKYNRYDKGFKEENSQLTDDYRRITEQYKDLQTKFKHFERYDEQRYADIWNMHQENVSEVAKKVLEADRVIHQQQLGMQWFPPSQNVFKRVENKKTINASTLKKAMTLTEAAKEKAGINDLAEEEGDGLPFALPADRRERSNLAREVLERISIEASFLIDDKTLKEAEACHDYGEKMLKKINGILTSLDITTPEEVENLVSHFAEQTPAGPKLAAKGNAMDSIKRFIASRRESEYVQDEARKTRALAPEARMESRRRESEYWVRLENIIRPDTMGSYERLAEDCEQYLTLVTSRSKFSNECGALRSQNQDLKVLLNKYMNHDVNDELHIPPIRTHEFQAMMSD